MREQQMGTGSLCIMVVFECYHFKEMPGAWVFACGDMQDAAVTLALGMGSTFSKALTTDAMSSWSLNICADVAGFIKSYNTSFGCSNIQIITRGGGGGGELSQRPTWGANPISEICFLDSLNIKQKSCIVPPESLTFSFPCFLFLYSPPATYRFSLDILVFIPSPFGFWWNQFSRMQLLIKGGK